MSKLCDDSEQKSVWRIGGVTFALKSTAGCFKFIEPVSLKKKKLMNNKESRPSPNYSNHSEVTILNYFGFSNRKLNRKL